MLFLDTQPERIKESWSIFHVGQTNPLQLRALSPKGALRKLPVKNITFTASKYPNINDRKAAFEREALRLNALGYNIYIVMNPITPEFLGNETNGLAVCDSDIECRRFLLIDIDRANAVGPIPEDDIDDMWLFTFKIEKYLKESGYADFFEVFSGNGAHIYLPLDSLPNDDTSKEHCQATLHALAKRFDNDTYKVDTCVYNASRITKVPGTIARKGIESEDCPYQIAHVVEVEVEVV